MAKAGNSRVPANGPAAARRRKVFVERYIVNGNNATEAATFCGLSAKTAYSTGQRLLKHPEVKALLEKRVEQVVVDARLSTDRWAKEIACIAHFDPGELYDGAGNLIPIHLLPEHVRRAIGSVNVERHIEGRGDDAKAVTTTSKIKLWDKNTALANVGKHLGMFERDNRQRAQAIQVVVQLVG